jgi:hypothetical protein
MAAVKAELLRLVRQVVAAREPEEEELELVVADAAT